jgi:hypothetical protein
MSDDLQQTPAESQPANPQLTIQDLALALQTIQVTAQRGAIRADEMSAVGLLHDKLLAFLKASGAFNTPAETETTDSAEQTQGE